jgi:hypothetical protein
MPSFQGWQGDKPVNSVKLPQKWIDKCVNMPESGMGYQKVSVRVANGSFSGIVLNCSILETVERVDPEKILDIIVI